MENETLHSLLSRGRLSGAQRDRILERVLDARAVPKRTRRSWGIALGILLPAAAVVALAIRTQSNDSDERGGSWLVPKGDSRGSIIEAHCLGRAAGECRPQDRLVFSVDGFTSGFLAAFAVCASGERIWYFPTADGQLPALPAGDGHRVIDQAVRVGDEHGFGRCELHVYVLSKPTRRAAIVAGDAPTTSHTVLPLNVSR